MYLKLACCVALFFLFFFLVAPFCPNDIKTPGIIFFYLAALSSAVFVSWLLLQFVRTIKFWVRMVAVDYELKYIYRKEKRWRPKDAAFHMQVFCRIAGRSMKLENRRLRFSPNALLWSAAFFVGMHAAAAPVEIAGLSTFSRRQTAAAVAIKNKSQSWDPELLAISCSWLSRLMFVGLLFWIFSLCGKSIL